MDELSLLTVKRTGAEPTRELGTVLVIQGQPLPTVYPVDRSVLEGRMKGGDGGSIADLPTLNYPSPVEMARDGWTTSDN